MSCTVSSGVFSFFRHPSALIVATILTTGLAIITTNCVDPDLWGHVQYGREVLRDGVLPRTATWTYAADGAPWVNHENIAEFLLAGTVDAFGTTGLLWMKLSLAAVIFCLMMYSARKSGAGWLAIAIVVVAVATNVQFHWHFRPQILTYTCLAIMLAIWQHVFHSRGSLREPCTRAAFCSRSEQRLWLLPPLMCFWANSHGGFAAGLAMLGAYHAIIMLQIVRSSGRIQTRTLMTLGLITVASFAATLINPYGAALWKFMLDALRLPRPEIADWGPLEIWSREASGFWLLIVVVGLSVVQDRRRLVPAQMILLGLLLWQGVSHCRHLSIFAIVCGFWIPRHLQSVIESVRNSLPGLQESLPRRRRGMIGSVILTGIVAFNGIRLAPKMTDVPVSRSEYPIAAMQFLHDRGLQGKVLVTFNWAQYAIGCFAAEADPDQQSRVAVDGRFETCYPREITDICFDFWLGQPDPDHRYRSPQTPPFDPARALEFQEPDLVLLSREQRPSVRVMQDHAHNWVLLYQDSLSQLWGRRSKYANAASPDFVAQSKRHVSNDVQLGSVAWPALPQNRKTDARMAASQGY